jgi:ketosteroid isomerase-like protein
MATERQRAEMQMLREAYDGFERRDFDQVRRVMDPGVELLGFLPGLTSPPRGFDSYMEWVEALFEAWEDWQQELVDIEPVGHRHYLARVHVRARGKGSGVPVEDDVVHMIDVVGGRVVRYHVYPGYDQALEAAHKGEAGDE